MHTLLLEKGGASFRVASCDLHLHTGALYAPELNFESFALLRRITRKSAALHRSGKLSKRQLWLGAYFHKEFFASALPDVSLRWIDDEMGWGVFAERDFKSMEFIAEYSGVLRKRRGGDEKNAYCFECPLIRGESSPYIIDARERGGISRYINHSDQPNVESGLGTILDAPHILLYTSSPVRRGEELCYDYGPDYWKLRSKRSLR